MIFRYFESKIENISYENLYDTDPHDLGCFKNKLSVNTPAEAENIKVIYKKP